MLQFSKVFEGHEFVIWFRRPRVDLDGVFEGNYKELNPLVFHNAEMNCALQFTDVNPAIPPFCLL